MGKTILFSPVGGTDPISLSNLHEGSMLHVCRVYHPDVVYLYLSKEMLNYHRKDNRYCYCLDRLQEQEHFKMVYKVIERENLNNVSEYDFFYPEFYRCLTEIQEEMQNDDVLLLNIASGTPAMKSALVVIQQLLNVPAKCIQVLTPTKEQNTHIKSDETYNVEEVWRLNRDNDKEHFKNRCVEISCPSLVTLKILEIIKEQILKYDYQAALSLVGTIPGRPIRKLEKLLALAKARQDLDGVKVDQLSKETGIDVIPIKSPGKRDIFEYALNLKNKLERREYADFIRAITPLFLDLFLRVLQDECAVPIHNYIGRDNHNSLVWNNLQNGSEVKNILDNAYGGHFRVATNYRPTYVQSDHLVALIKSKTSAAELVNAVDQLRLVEIKVRNIAAHEIVSITDHKINNLTGLTGEGIMELIRKVFTYTSMYDNGLNWDSYREMNEKIIEAVSKEMNQSIEVEV